MMTEKLNNMYTSTITSDSLNMVSLFEYLGHAAGKNLGKEVAIHAIKYNIPTQTRHVSNKKYTGLVTLYPKFFLEQFFNPKSST